MVMVTFNITRDGSVSYIYDNDAEVVAISERNITANLGLRGGFVVVSVGKMARSTTTYLSLKDGCAPVMDMLDALLDTIPEKDAILAFTYRIDKDVWTQCDLMERYYILDQFLMYGSLQLSHLSKISTHKVATAEFDLTEDLIGAKDLQIAIVGYKCNVYHTNAAMDRVCPGGSDCPATGIWNVSVGTVELDGASCSSLDVTGMFWLCFCIGLAIYLCIACTWTRKLHFQPMHPISAAKVLQVEYQMRKSYRGVETAPCDDVSERPSLRVYWFYIDIDGEPRGPISNDDIDALYRNPQSHLDQVTQIREAWWPSDCYHTVKEIFPRSNAFQVKPALPPDVVEFLRVSVNKVEKRPSRVRRKTALE